MPWRQVPAAVARMGLDRRVRATPGLRFAKLLGTAGGSTFTARDADPRHWGLLATWESPEAARDFEASRTAAAWGRIAEETLRVRMVPLASHGRWAGVEPFGAPPPRRWDGRVAAVTRARLRARTMPTFWRASPSVTRAVLDSPGLLLTTGIGEAPVGLQGTFSLWESAATLSDFAYRDPRHVDAIRRTGEVGWYVEELFARFGVLDVTGRFAGSTWEG
ncbi:MAG TPA: hypothetical protein VK894_14115 [Jiangellales bacterium]|nr:hypothetical protein [Jiangellales bacterium]